MFGKAVDLSTLPLPQKVVDQTPPASTTVAPPKDSTTEDEGSVTAGFSYVKRDLVRLLGILCAGETVVQDRVRACGGIPVVMNLCVVDERNPCKCPELYVSQLCVFLAETCDLLCFAPFLLGLVVLPRH